MICLTASPVFSQEASNTSSNQQPAKYELGKYQFNLDSNEKFTFDKPVRQIEQSAENLNQTIKNTTQQADRVIKNYSNDAISTQKEIVNRVKQESTDTSKQLQKFQQSTSNSAQRVINQTERTVKKEMNNVNKAVNNSEIKRKFDPNKPPHPFMIVPIQYKGEMKKTIEKL